ncbi:uncharacterized protein LOC134553672 isoform X2 [Prinia subflava]|uniref:uncharacterized protein LOC134553672 isoform X2 n=1 Tax=Prinia subflava TaxID=208062 RepID=UPI002FE05C9A
MLEGRRWDRMRGKPMIHARRKCNCGGLLSEPLLSKDVHESFCSSGIEPPSTHSENHVAFQELHMHSSKKFCRQSPQRNVLHLGSSAEPWTSQTQENCLCCTCPDYMKRIFQVYRLQENTNPVFSKLLSFLHHHTGSCIGHNVQEPCEAEVIVCHYSTMKRGPSCWLLSVSSLGL